MLDHKYLKMGGYFDSSRQEWVIPQQATLQAMTQYADVAAWQRERLKGEVLAEQLAYWKNALAGLQTLELPADRPRPAIPSFIGGRERIAISPANAAALQALCDRVGVTPFMALLAAFKLLLFRYTAQEDVAVGCPIANRTRPEIELLIGFFVNTLVLRTSLAGEPTFRETLGRVREVALSAYAHQDLPFERLVEELQPLRDPSRNPLFQVTFQLLERAAAPEMPAHGLFHTVDVEFRTAKFDLPPGKDRAIWSILCCVLFSSHMEPCTFARRSAG